MIHLLLVVGVILGVLWLFGLVTSHTFGGFLHIALVIALILIIIWLIKVVFKVF
jgi:hypothetical protein